MSEPASSAKYTIVTKVGAAVLREQGGQLQVLVIQPKPKPKTPDDLPPIGLVRGTRMYRDASGALVDANHDGRTVEAGVEFEPVRETLIREIEEEAGVTQAMLAAAQIIDLGPHIFPSQKKIPYPIHWFLVVFAADAVLPHDGFKDSLYSKWCTLDEAAELISSRKMSQAYAGVIDRALDAYQALQTKP